ncbi:hypothetical protein ACIBXA_23640 [Micromonospora echinaurantiaca]
MTTVEAGQERQAGEGSGRSGEAEQESGGEQQLGPPAQGAGRAGTEA